MTDGSLSKEFERASKTKELVRLIRNLSVDEYSNSAETEFDQDLTKIETRLKEISLWIEDSVKDLEKLPANPTSFDEILATIEPERTKKVKNLKFELTQLQERRDNLSEQHEVLSHKKKYQDRLFGAVQNERAVKNELKGLEEASNKRIGMAAFMFKKRIRNFIEEYWADAQVTRKSLDTLQKRSGRRLPDNFDVDRMLKQATDDRKTIEELETKVTRLARLGGFIGKMREEGAQDIQFDSMDMKKVYETAIDKINKRVKLLEDKVKEAKRANEFKKLQQYDDEHKKENMVIFLWSDEMLQEVLKLSEDAKKLLRSEGRTKNKKLDKINERMKEIMNVEIPIKEIAITEKMTTTSNLLQDLKYPRTEMVKEREQKLRVNLNQLRKKIAKEQNNLFAEENKLLIEQRAKSIREVVRKVYSLDLKDEVAFLIADYADTRPTEEVKKVKKKPAPKVEKRKSKVSSPTKKKPSPAKKKTPKKETKPSPKKQEEEKKSPPQEARKVVKKSPSFDSVGMKGSTIRTASTILRETPVDIKEQAAKEASPEPVISRRKTEKVEVPPQPKPAAPKEEQKQEEEKIVQKPVPVNLPPKISVPDQQKKDSLPPVKPKQVLTISTNSSTIEPVPERPKTEAPQVQVPAEEFAQPGSWDFAPKPGGVFLETRASADLSNPVPSLDTYLPTIFDSPQPRALGDSPQVTPMLSEVNLNPSMDDQSTLISELTEELERLHSEMDTLREQVKKLKEQNKFLEHENGFLALKNSRMRRQHNATLTGKV